MKPYLYLDEDTMATALVVALRANKRTLYTFNVSDFCRLHREYLDHGTEHAGIIVVPRQRYDVKQHIRLLLNVLKTKSAEEMHNTLCFL